MLTRAQASAAALAAMLFGLAVAAHAEERDRAVVAFGCALGPRFLTTADTTYLDALEGYFGDPPAAVALDLRMWGVYPVATWLEVGASVDYLYHSASDGLNVPAAGFPQKIAHHGVDLGALVRLVGRSRSLFIAGALAVGAQLPVAVLREEATLDPRLFLRPVLSAGYAPTRDALGSPVMFDVRVGYTAAFPWGGERLSMSGVELLFGMQVLFSRSS
jgi:hypothetical protein